MADTDDVPITIFASNGPDDIRDQIDNASCTILWKSLCLVLVILVIYLVWKLVNSNKDNFDRDSPNAIYEFPYEYILPFDGKVDDVKPEEVVALWDDHDVIRDFEYSKYLEYKKQPTDDKSKGYNGLVYDENTMIKENPTEDFLWSQMHSPSI